MNMQTFTFIAAIALVGTNTVSAMINITEIINNTDQDLYLKYNVPVHAEIINWTNDLTRPYPDRKHKPLLMLNKGISKRSKALLHATYIPTATSKSDYYNVLTLSLYHDVTGDLALIRTNDGWLEKIQQLAQFNTRGKRYMNYPAGNHKISRIFDEKITKGDTYTLEVKQISDEVHTHVFLGKSIESIMSEKAFEIIFKKNN